MGIALPAMPHVTNRSWTEGQLQTMREMHARGASVDRVSVALKRSIHSVRTKAAALGIPFPKRYELRQEQLAKEGRARAAVRLPAIE